MDNSSILPGKDPAPVPPSGSTSLIPEGLKTILIFALMLGVGYLLFDSYSFHEKNKADLDQLVVKMQELENRNKANETKLASLRGEVVQTAETVGTAKAELKKIPQQISAEGERTKAELNKAISTKADTAQVHQVQADLQAAKSDAEAKIGQVSTEVGGVKTDVTTVKGDLASTRRDLEGTQRQLVDVRESLTAAVAKNSGELAELRRKGEKDYIEFQIPKRDQITKVEDIRVVLTKTDAKKGKFSLQILVDDNKADKKDRAVNEPLQFLVGRNRIRYELVINWVKKDSAGGYLSVPKDKTLSSEHPNPK